MDKKNKTITISELEKIFDEKSDFEDSFEDENCEMEQFHKIERKYMNKSLDEYISSKMAGLENKF